MNLLLEPLSHAFMVRALLVSALVGGVCGLLSCYMTLKGWALMGDAVSHAVLPGVVVAYALGLPFSLGAFVFGVGSVAAIGWDAERRSRGWFHRLGALEMLWLILRLHSHCGPLTLGRGRPGVTVDGQGSGPDDWTGWATVLRQDERIGLRRGASCLRVTRPY